MKEIIHLLISTATHSKKGRKLRIISKISTFLKTLLLKIHLTSKNETWLEPAPCSIDFKRFQIMIPGNIMGPNVVFRLHTLKKYSSGEASTIDEGITLNLLKQRIATACDIILQ